MSYSKWLFRSQDLALERAYNASLEPPDDYYFEVGGEGGQDDEEGEGTEE